MFMAKEALKKVWFQAPWNLCGVVQPLLGIIVLVLGFLIMGEFDKSPELESAAAAIESVESVTAPPTEQLASIPNQEQSMVTTQGNSDTSFDCRKAISRLENLICSDTNLASLDKALNDAYSSRIESASERSGPFVWTEFLVS